MADPFCIQNDIRELRNLGCEYVIVQCHWAEGIASQHGSMQEAMARACERYGADLVIGSGPDCAQGIGYVNRMPVVWSLGKLLSDKGKERDAILVQVHFSFEDQIQGIYLEIVPVLAGFYTQKDTDLNRPSIAGGEDRIRILTSVQNDSVISISDLTCQQ